MRELDLRDPSLVGRSLVVSASAGSGKTFTLSVLVCGTLGRGTCRPHEVLATTFSEAAASDLRERLLRPLDLLAGLDEATWKALLPILGDGPAFATALKALPLGPRLGKAVAEVAAAAVLWTPPDGLRPVWAASAASARTFWRRTRREAELLRVSTLHALALGLLRLQGEAPAQVLDAEHPALLRLLRQALREALTLAPEHPDAAAARRLLAWAERNWEEVSKLHDAHRDANGHLEGGDVARRRSEAEAAFGELAAGLAPYLSGALELRAAKKDGSLHGDRDDYLRLGPAPEGPAWGPRLDWAEALAARAFTTKDEEGNARPPLTRLTEGFAEALEPMHAFANAWEAWLRDLLREALARFEARKRARGLATFGDLVRAAAAGLEAGTIPPPAPTLLVVDEHQDVSRAQESLLKALGASATVVVGDVKQAIYGFRGGDPDLLRRRLSEAGADAFRLGANFRSAPAVVDLANTFVATVWPQLDAAGADPGGIQRAEGSGAWPVSLLPVPADQPRDLAALAPAITALATEPGWAELAGPAPEGPRRRALLLRQRTHLPRLLLRLKQAGVRPYVVSTEGYWESPGVRLVLAALEAVAHPDRAVPCAALLRLGLGLTDGELTALAAAQRRGLPGLGDLAPEQLPERHRAGAGRLKALRDCDTQTLAGRLLGEGGLLPGIAATEAHGALEPERARRNLGALLALMLELPASPAAAYAHLEELRAGKPRGDLPAAVEGADLLVQTAHGSKGLEYDDLILPVLGWTPQAMRKGQGGPAADGSLLLAWKLGPLTGRAYRELRAEHADRQRRDSLNLFYVALTRAKARLALLTIPAPPAKTGKAGTPAPSQTWAQWTEALAEAHPALHRPEGLGVHRPEPPAGPPPLQPPPLRAGIPDPVAVPAEQALPPRERALRQRQGEAMHAFLQDLLMRREDAAAFQARLAAPPEVPRAAAMARAFFEAFAARGWDAFPRRTELALEGAAASGARGRADLVVWEPDRRDPAAIHLVDFKTSDAFGPEELAKYRAQLQRYADVLRRPGVPVKGWLVALRSGAWVEVGL